MVSEKKAMEYLNRVDPDQHDIIDLDDDGVANDPGQIDSEYLTFITNDNANKISELPFLLGWYATVGTDEDPIDRDLRDIISDVEEEGVKVGLKNPNIYSDSRTC
jgi:hypothetical protein